MTTIGRKWRLAKHSKSRPFHDGYVKELRVKELANGLFVFVGTVKPTMVSQANCGAKSYKLWFVMDGERKSSESQNSSTVWSPTTGSILSAYCLCPGGQDGASVWHLSTKESKLSAAKPAYFVCVSSANFCF